MIPVIDKDVCDGCKDCVEACPPEVISMVDGKAVIDESLCEECGECVDECPSGAITLPRK
ncbi:MAG: 4Fe-4S ferredoxin iron-sulfur binding domain protein [Ignavibacteria bacterium]|nr:4Fe-4S ferredoxin iron-sulfur binding domain protein [Ignavibacteria bacterium]